MKLIPSKSYDNSSLLASLKWLKTLSSQYDTYSTQSSNTNYDYLALSLEELIDKLEVYYSRNELHQVIQEAAYASLSCEDGFTTRVAKKFDQILSSKIIKLNGNEGNRFLSKHILLKLYQIQTLIRSKTQSYSISGFKFR